MGGITGMKGVPTAVGGGGAYENVAGELEVGMVTATERRGEQGRGWFGIFVDEGGVDAIELSTREEKGSAGGEKVGGNEHAVAGFGPAAGGGGPGRHVHAPGGGRVFWGGHRVDVPFGWPGAAPREDLMSF